MGWGRVLLTSLESASRGLARSVDDHEVAVQKLQSGVLGAGSPWGSDEVGALSSDAYDIVIEIEFKSMSR